MLDGDKTTQIVLWAVAAAACLAVLFASIGEKRKKPQGSWVRIMRAGVAFDVNIIIIILAGLLRSAPVPEIVKQSAAMLVMASALALLLACLLYLLPAYTTRVVRLFHADFTWELNTYVGVNLLVLLGFVYLTYVLWLPPGLAWQVFTALLCLMLIPLNYRLLQRQADAPIASDIQPVRDAR